MLFKLQIHRYVYFAVSLCLAFFALGCEADRSNAFDPNSCNYVAVAPSNLEASQGLYPDKVELSWNKVEHAQKYFIFRSNQDQDLAKIGETSESTYSDTTLQNNVEYKYSVVPVFEKEVSGEFSNIATGYRLELLPQVSASDGKYQEKVVITWNPVANAKTYNIYRVSGDAEMSLIGTSETIEYIDDNTLNNKSYNYAVSVVYNNDVISEISTFDSGFRQEKLPSILVSDGTYQERIEISWKEISNAEKYYLYRESENGEFLKVSETEDTNFIDNNTSNNKKYKYSLCVKYDNGIISEKSATVTGYRLENPPAVQVTDGEYPHYTKISWNSIPRAGKYLLFRKKNASDPYTQLTETTSLSYYDQEIDNLDEYSYCVSTVFTNGINGIKGESDKGYRQFLAVPQNIKISSGVYDGKVEISCASVPGADGYKLYRSTDINGDYAYRKTSLSTSFIDLTTGPDLNGVQLYYKMSAYSSVTGNEGEQSTPFTGLSLRKLNKAINGANFLFNKIPSGSFIMGDENIGGADNPHPVIISHDFYVSETEVTFEQWNSIYSAAGILYTLTDMASCGTYNTGDEAQPVTRVSWIDAIIWCNLLSELDPATEPSYYYKDIHGNLSIVKEPVYSSKTIFFDPTKSGYRLLTEAEWEYACRAWADTKYFWGDNSDVNTVSQYAYYYYNSYSATHNCGEKLPNRFHLFDMLGNVSEWCFDYYSPYNGAAVSDPVIGNETISVNRVFRGGSLCDTSTGIYAAGRDYENETSSNLTRGFRIAINAQ